MTNNADDVFDDDDPFQNLEERLTDALDSAAQAESEASEEPESTNDAELRLVMERIKTRSASRRPSDVEAVAQPAEVESQPVQGAPARARELPTTRNFAGIQAGSSDSDSNQGDSSQGDSSQTDSSQGGSTEGNWGPGDLGTGEEPDHLGSREMYGTDAEIVRVGRGHISEGRDFRSSTTERGAAKYFSDDDQDPDELLDDDPVIPEWSFAIASIEQDSLEAADQAIDLSDLPDFLGDHDDDSEDHDPEPESAPPASVTPDEPVFDQPRSSTFGSRVIDLGADSRRTTTRPAPDPDNALQRSADKALQSSPPTQLPPSGIGAAPPSGATAVQPVVAIGHTPGAKTGAPAASSPPRPEPQGPMTTTLVIPREPVSERKNSSRGLLFTAGGITLIVLSVLVYASYLRGQSTAPTTNMDPALEETTPTSEDVSSTTTSAAAASPEVELTACDSEAAHVTITTQSATPIIAMIRFQFLKDGEIYYEEDSETPAITAGEPLTKSLLLIGKDLPQDYVGVEPDDCQVQVIGVAAA